MGEVKTVGDVVAVLTRLNPRVQRQELALYAGLYCDYVEAERNVAEHGAITLHPRTGAPMENPYLKIKNAASAQLRKFKLQTSELWP